MFKDVSDILPVSVDGFLPIHQINLAIFYRQMSHGFHVEQVVLAGFLSSNIASSIGNEHVQPCMRLLDGLPNTELAGAAG